MVNLWDIILLRVSNFVNATSILCFAFCVFAYLHKGDEAISICHSIKATLLHFSSFVSSVHFLSPQTLSEFHKDAMSAHAHI